MTGVFVTGTDTGVGKTHVAKRLLAELRARGHRACGLKPIETGGDADVRALDSPRVYVLRLPAAPAAAAEAEGVTIDLGRILDAARALAASADVIVAEGAGGLLVPITATLTMADLAAALGLPLLLVTRARLGTINHTLLTVREIERRGIAFLGTLLNAHSPRTGGAAAEDDSLDHARWIDAFGGKILGVYPGGVDWDALARSITSTR